MPVSGRQHREWLYSVCITKQTKQHTLGKMVFLRILSGASSASLDDTVCKSIDGTVIIIPGCDGCGKNAEGRLRYFFEAGR